MYGIIRHFCVILALLVLYREWSNNPPAVEAFVAPRPPRVNVGAPGEDARAAGPFANEINSRGAGGESWRTADHLPRRRRSREAGGGGGSGCGQGVRSLRAGLGFPPLPGSELVDFMAQELVEQSVRHHWQSGFIGGSVGVMGTLTAIQIKINEVKELTACPYCRSTGQLACATCYGIGSVSIPDTIDSSNAVTTTTLTCPSCRGQTFITCVNCRGDGRGVPLFLNKKVSRDPESEIEDVGYA
eukprot:jgi/Undpi1/1519/HiC_scaffold_11.g04909.m1